MSIGTVVEISTMHANATNTKSDKPELNETFEFKEVLKEEMKDIDKAEIENNDKAGKTDKSVKKSQEKPEFQKEESKRASLKGKGDENTVERNRKKKDKAKVIDIRKARKGSKLVKKKKEEIEAVVDKLKVFKEQFGMLYMDTIVDNNTDMVSENKSEAGYRILIDDLKNYLELNVVDNEIDSESILSNFEVRKLIKDIKAYIKLLKNQYKTENNSNIDIDDIVKIMDEPEDNDLKQFEDFLMNKDIDDNRKKVKNFKQNVDVPVENEQSSSIKETTVKNADNMVNNNNSFTKIGMEKIEVNFRNNVSSEVKSVPLNSGKSMIDLVNRMENFQEIVNKMNFMVANNKSSMTMRLKPEFLGKMNLRVFVQDGNVNGKVFVETPTALELFKLHMSELKDTLAESGLNIQEFEVFLNNGSDRENQRHAFEFAANDNNAVKKGFFEDTESLFDKLSMFNDDSSINIRV